MGADRPGDEVGGAITCALNIAWSEQGSLIGTVTCGGVSRTFTGVMELVALLEGLLDEP